MKDLLFTIIYFRDGQFFMISSNAFKRRSSANRCADEFCKSHKGDGYTWTYDIDKLELRS